MRNRFATALLGTLLLLPAASAQTLTPTQQTNVPALPAAPAQATPAQTAPNQPASVQPVPTPASGPTILTLNAPVGSSVELQSIITSRLTVSGVQVSAAPGSKVSQSKLDAARREITQAMQKMNGASTQAIRGKVFYKVASRDAAGNTVLVSTIVTNMPASTGTSGSKAAKATNSATSAALKITQTIAPSGKVSGLSIDSDNPQISAMYKSFTPERLQQLADQNGASFGGIYGVPLVAGQARTSTTSLDAQSMLGSLLGAVAGPRSQDVFGKVQATPLTVTTSNTYTGQNAQGQYTFATSSQFADWRVTLSGKGQAPTIAMQLAQAQASGQSVYMPSGLPVASEQKSDMQMKMTLTMDDIQVSMQMTIDQGVSLQPR